MLNSEVALEINVIGLLCVCMQCEASPFYII